MEFTERYTETLTHFRFKISVAIATDPDINMEDEMSPDELQELYTWIDEVPLSRPKRNITRDFADGVLAAELVSHYFPRWVELHNYTPANSKTQKMDNWQTLNRKVLSRLGLHLTDDLLEGLVNSKPGCVEQALASIRDKIEAYQNEQHHEPSHLHQGRGPDTHGMYPSGRERDMDHLAYTQQAPHPGLAYIASPTTVSRRPTFERPPQQVGDSFTDSYSDHLRHSLPAEPPPLHASPRRQANSSRIPLPAGREQDTQTHGLKEPRQSIPSLPPIVPKGKSLSAPQPKSRERPQFHLPTVMTNTRRVNKREEERLRSASRRMQLAEREQIILESQETVQLLQMKIHRLEHLLTIKDMKIEELTRRLQESTQKKQTKTPSYPKYRR